MMILLAVVVGYILGLVQSRPEAPKQVRERIKTTIMEIRHPHPHSGPLKRPTAKDLELQADPIAKGEAEAMNQTLSDWEQSNLL